MTTLLPSLSSGNDSAASRMASPIAVGTEAGGYFVDINHPRRDYKRDRSGNPIRSTLNADMVETLAQAGGGKAYFLSNANTIADPLNEEIDRIEKREYEEQTFTEYESHFQLFLWVALFLFLLEFLLSYRPVRWLQDKDIFRKT